MPDALYIAALIFHRLVVVPLLALVELWLIARLLRGRKLSARVTILIATSLVLLAATAAWVDSSSSILAGFLLALAALVGLAIVFRRAVGLSRWRTATAIVLFFSMSVAVDFSVAYFVLRPTIFDPVRAASPNMAPTLQSGDGFLVDRTMRPSRWDIVSFRSPGDPDTTRVARLIGLPDEVIELRDGEIYRNGAILTKPPHLTSLRFNDDGGGGRCNGCPGNPIKLGADECYLLGDNPWNSLDSRWFEPTAAHQAGAVPWSDLIGVARFRYAPLERIGFLR
jgi:signal peptidase I